MSGLLILPLIVPLVTAAAALLVAARPRWLRTLAVAGALVQVCAAAAVLQRVRTSGIQVLHVGSWRAPFGVTLVADHLAAVLVLMAALIALAAAVFALRDEPRSSAFYPLLHFLVAGVTGAFLAGDLFNLYVWFEVLLVASFALLALDADAARLAGAFQYVAMNLLSSLALLSGIGILYGLTGTVNLADMAVRLSHLDPSGPKTAAAVLLAIALAIKAAVFPFFLWLTVSYHTLPVAVAALFSGLLTKVGIYALIRCATLLVPDTAARGQDLLLIAAGVTMVTGVLGAAAQTDVRRILSIHVVSQIGYLIMGLALATPLALSGTLFYIVHVALVKATLFLLAGAMYQVGGSFSVDEIGGLARAHPVLAILFLMSALSLAGVPPASGFWAKLLVVRAGLDVHAWILTATALAVSIGTLYSMLKIWNRAFGGAAPATMTAPAARVSLLSIGGLTAISLLIGLWAQPLLALTDEAARELLDPAGYVRAVLGAGP